MRRSDSGIVLGLYRSRHERGILECALSLGVRNLDTSFNYYKFKSHEALARDSADLLPLFDISTKIGFFPGRDGDRHAIDPIRLARASQLTVERLSVVPAVMFIHNPEASLGHGTPEQDRDALLAAFDAMENARRSGLCRSWGISTWNPRYILRALEAGDRIDFPGELLVRSGLLVKERQLEEIERLVTALDVAGTGRLWGMSPFGGRPPSATFQGVDLAEFVVGGAHFSNPQIAFCLAFRLPSVSRVVVGTDNATHLEGLLAASSLQINESALLRYRTLLRAADP